MSIARHRPFLFRHPHAHLFQQGAQPSCHTPHPTRSALRLPHVNYMQSFSGPHGFCSEGKGQLHVAGPSALTLLLADQPHQVADAMPYRGRRLAEAHTRCDASQTQPTRSERHKVSRCRGALGRRYWAEHYETAMASNPQARREPREMPPQQAERAAGGSGRSEGSYEQHSSLMWRRGTMKPPCRRKRPWRAQNDETVKQATNQTGHLRQAGGERAPPHDHLLKGF